MEQVPSYYIKVKKAWTIAPLTHIQANQDSTVRAKNRCKIPASHSILCIKYRPSIKKLGRSSLKSQEKIRGRCLVKARIGLGLTTLFNN